MRNVAELFPVKPRPGQLEAAETLASLLDEASRVVFTAPPGFGKTLAVAVALKAKNLLPAVWRVRSLALARHIADDAALLDLHSEVLPGRERVCPHALTLGLDVHEWCRINRAQCRYFSARSCPYFFHPSADVYTISYFRRSPPHLTDVWDEAHNLLAPRETCISAEAIIEASGELKSINSEVADKVKALAPFEREGEVVVEEGILAALYTAYLKLIESGEGRTATGRLFRVLKSQSIYAEGGRLCGASVTFPLRCPAVFISATLPYPEVLGGRMLEVPWTRKYRAVVLEGLTTRYTQFTEKEVKEYGKLLWDLRKRYEKVLVFATERVAKHLVKFANVYEPVELSEWRGVLLLHARGRFSEGVNVKADVVVMAGAPFQPPWIIDRLKKVLMGMGLTDAANRIADVSMLSVTLQCVGRAMRSPDDNPLIILADERYKRYEAELSKYFNYVSFS